MIPTISQTHAIWQPQQTTTMAFRCSASSIFSPRRKVSVYRVKSEPIDQPITRDSNITEEQQFIKCCVKTAKSSRCSNQAKTYNEDAKMWVCGIHDNMLKASGICVICLEPMDNPTDRIKLECKHTYHKQCICHLDLASCPCCRAPIMDKYAKKIFTNTKLSPLAEKVFSLRPEKQKAFFSIANRLVEVLGDISDDTDDAIGQIMMLKSYISTYSFGIKSLQQYNGDGLGIMEDWSVAATTAFEHIRQYDTYDGLVFSAEGMNFWTDSRPPQPVFTPSPAVDRVITSEPPFIPIQPLQQPTDPRLAVNMQFVPVVQPGQVAQLQPAFVPPAPVDIDMEWNGEPYTPTAPAYSPTSPSLIRMF
jgi:RING-like zinc finger